MKRVVALGVVCAVAVMGSAVCAYADTVVVNPGGSWTSTGNTGGGSSEITSTMPDNYGGAGSLEMFGDRTRFEFIPGGSLGLLSDLDALSFDWMVALDSTSNLHADYTPAVRLLVYDPDANDASELIWEGAYNGYYGSYTHGTWVSTDVTGDSETLWQWNSGVTMDGGAQVNLTPAGWASSSFLGSNTVVYGISFGVGSSIGSGYHAFGDYLTIGFDGTSTTYNFEPAAVVPAPPAIGLAGLGLAFLATRRAMKKKKA